MNVTITSREWAELEASRSLPREQRLDVARKVYAPKPKSDPSFWYYLARVLIDVVCALLVIALVLAVGMWWM